jgi:anti-sigma28 factor (negative regulator of flagellin synthesis)
MGITKIGSLFAANTDPVPAVKAGSPVSPQGTQTQNPQHVSGDAAIVSKNLQNVNRTPLGDAEASRAAKVKLIKEQVRRGDYKPDKQGVAMSIIRDLA